MWEMLAFYWPKLWIFKRHYKIKQVNNWLSNLRIIICHLLYRILAMLFFSFLITRKVCTRFGRNSDGRWMTGLIGIQSPVSVPRVVNAPPCPYTLGPGLHVATRSARTGGSPRCVASVGFSRCTGVARICTGGN